MNASSASWPSGSILFDCVGAVGTAGIAFDVWHANHHLAALRARLQGAVETAYASAACRSLASGFELPEGLAIERALSAAAAPHRPVLALTGYSP